MSILVSILMAFSIVFAQNIIEVKTEVRPMTPQEVFVPNDFDDNDNVLLVYEGLFSSSCYRYGVADYYVDETAMKIKIQENAFYFPFEICLRMTTPYSRELAFGMLKEGKYDVEFLQKDGTYLSLSTLEVKKSNKLIVDDYVYAPVEQVSVHSTADKVTIKGAYTNSCMSLDRVEVHYKKGSNTIDILPISKIKGQPCAVTAGKKFRRTIDLKNIPQGRYMLHIRSLNGQARNHFIEIN